MSEAHSYDEQAILTSNEQQKLQESLLSYARTIFERFNSESSELKEVSASARKQIAVYILESVKSRLPEFRVDFMDALIEHLREQWDKHINSQSLVYQISLERSGVQHSLNRAFDKILWMAVKLALDHQDGDSVERTVDANAQETRRRITSRYFVE